MAVNIKRTASAVRQIVKADKALAEKALKQLGDVNIQSLESLPAPKGLVGPLTGKTSAFNPNLKSVPSFQSFVATRNFKEGIPLEEMAGSPVSSRIIKSADAKTGFGQRMRQAADGSMVPDNPGATAGMVQPVGSPIATSGQAANAVAEAAAPAASQAAPAAGGIMANKWVQRGIGVGVTGFMVTQMAGTRGAQSNDELYNQR